jgi:hypothetical protein
VDVRHLLRIPEDFEIEPEAEDELECLNLDITGPPLSSINGPLPVLVWIYGTMADLQAYQAKALILLTAVP